MTVLKEQDHSPGDQHARPALSPREVPPRRGANPREVQAAASPLPFSALSVPGAGVGEDPGTRGQEQPFLIQVGEDKEAQAPSTPESRTPNIPLVVLIYLRSQELSEGRAAWEKANCEPSSCFSYKKWKFIFVSLLLCDEMSMRILKWKDISKL